MPSPVLLFASNPGGSPDPIVAHGHMVGMARVAVPTVSFSPRSVRQNPCFRALRRSSLAMSPRVTAVSRSHRHTGSAAGLFERQKRSLEACGE